MRKTIVCLLSAVLLCAVIFSAGCTAPAEVHDEIIGIWSNDSNTNIITTYAVFSEDCSGLICTGDENGTSGNEEQITWKAVGKDTYTITGSDALQMTCTLDNGTKTLKFSNGMCFTKLSDASSMLQTDDFASRFGLIGLHEALKKYLEY